MAHPRLTILILAQNSARHLERTLPNLRDVADELVVGVDSLSTDDSPDVVKPFADCVFGFPHEAALPADAASPGVDDFLLPHCTGDWILRVDHDETLGPEWRQESLLDSILSDRGVTHAFVPRRWAIAGDRYLSGRHWHPDADLRLFRNIPSIVRGPRTWHQQTRVAGEGRFLAEAYLVHWKNAWTSREERAATVRFYAGASSYTSHELYLYENQPYRTRPLAEPLPDPRFDVDYPASADARFRAAIHVLQAPDTMLAGDIEPVLVSIHNGSSRRLRPDSDLVRDRGLRLAYHWWSDPPGSEPVVFDGERWVLPRSIEPGEYALAWMRLRAPAQPGAYRAQLDLVEEGVSWFGAHVETPSFPVNVVAWPQENWYPELPEALHQVGPSPGRA
jgi:hypothetical protein